MSSCPDTDLISCADHWSQLVDCTQLTGPGEEKQCSLGTRVVAVMKQHLLSLCQSDLATNTIIEIASNSNREYFIPAENVAVCRDVPLVQTSRGRGFSMPDCGVDPRLQQTSCDTPPSGQTFIHSLRTTDPVSGRISWRHLTSSEDATCCPESEG